MVEEPLFLGEFHPPECHPQDFALLPAWDHHHLEWFLPLASDLWVSLPASLLLDSALPQACHQVPPLQVSLQVLFLGYHLQGNVILRTSFFSILKICFLCLHEHVLWILVDSKALLLVSALHPLDTQDHLSSIGLSQRSSKTDISSRNKLWVCNKIHLLLLVGIEIPETHTLYQLD
jgi:hypothetical protein